MNNNWGEVRRQMDLALDAERALARARRQRRLSGVHGGATTNTVKYSENRRHIMSNPRHPLVTFAIVILSYALLAGLATAWFNF